MKYLLGSITNLGINGVKIRRPYLYWSNTGNPIFTKIRINAVGEPTGPSEVLASVRQVDNFVFRADGDSSDVPKSTREFECDTTWEDNAGGGK